MNRGEGGEGEWLGQASITRNLTGLRTLFRHFGIVTALTPTLFGCHFYPLIDAELPQIRFMEAHLVV